MNCCEKHNTDCEQGRKCPARNEEEWWMKKPWLELAFVLALIAFGAVLEIAALIP